MEGGRKERLDRATTSTFSPTVNAFVRGHQWTAELAWYQSNGIFPDNKGGAPNGNLLIFTGARKGEIETLKWADLDLECGYLRLSDSKTGQKAIPLNACALEVLVSLPRFVGSPYVFPAHRGDGHYEGTPKVWRIVRAKAGLEDVRLHDLRHSFASIAVSGGASLPIIGTLLGHTNSATTQRYAHLHDDPLKAASEAVGNKIAASFSYDREGQLIGMDRS